MSIESLSTFSFRHTRYYHQCRYYSLCYLDHRQCGYAEHVCDPCVKRTAAKAR